MIEPTADEAGVEHGACYIDEHAKFPEGMECAPVFGVEKEVVAFHEDNPSICRDHGAIRDDGIGGAIKGGHKYGAVCFFQRFETSGKPRDIEGIRGSFTGEKSARVKRLIIKVKAIHGQDGRFWSKVRGQTLGKR